LLKYPSRLPIQPSISRVSVPIVIQHTASQSRFYWKRRRQHQSAPRCRLNRPVFLEPEDSLRERDLLAANWDKPRDRPSALGDRPLAATLNVLQQSTQLRLRVAHPNRSRSAFPPNCSLHDHIIPWFVWPCQKRPEPRRSEWADGTRRWFGAAVRRDLGQLHGCRQACPAASRSMEAADFSDAYSVT